MIRPLHDDFQCFVYDGEVAIRKNGMISLNPDSVVIHVDEQDAIEWAYSDVQLEWDGAYDEPVQLKNINHLSVVVVHNPEFLDALKQHIPNVADRAWWDIRLEGWPAVMVSCAIVLVLGSLIYYKGVPLFSDFMARFTPKDIEEKMGKATLNLLVPVRDRCGNAESELILRKISDPLIAADQSGYQYNIVYARLGMLNAFAAPGGFIVISESLLSAVKSPEELAGVIAHEMQHVVHKHSTRALARKMGGRAILSMMSLDSAGTPIGFEQAAGLAELSFQRDDETEADESAIALLVQAGINPVGLVKFLEMVDLYMDAKQSKYLSTHPMTHDRVKNLRKLISENGNYKEILTAEEWQIARTVCRGPGNIQVIHPKSLE